MKSQHLPNTSKLALTQQTDTLSLIILMLLSGLSSFVTAYLVMFGRYLELGYQETDKNIAYAGMQIWDLHHVFIVITLVLYACVLTCICWPKLFHKPLGLPKVLVLFISLMSLAITFFPYPLEFQLRHYASASDGSYVLLAQNSADFVDGNEGAFTGSIQEQKVESFYNKDGSTRHFNCVTNDAWWWGKLAVTHHFYPILDDQNQLTLLEKRCKEITHE